MKFKVVNADGVFKQFFSGQILFWVSGYSLFKCFSSYK